MSAGAGEPTPGPWRIDANHGVDGISIVGKPKWGCHRYGVDGEWDVAHIELLDGRPEETLANCDLIAAVWDLLAACKAVVASGVRNAAYDACVAAIAKAKGGEA